jgi:catechol 2,3-dioxygenase-like lactoylglutathione lyase family enzyme
MGQTTLLLFHLGDTSKDEDFQGYPGRGQIAGHGPDAQIVTSLGLGNMSQHSNNHPEVSLKLHFAFAVEKREDVYAWEDHFNKTNVHIHSTMEWERGGRSVYFFDPDGHVGEIVSRGIWPHW